MRPVLPDIFIAYLCRRLLRRGNGDDHVHNFGVTYEWHTSHQINREVDSAGTSELQAEHFRQAGTDADVDVAPIARK